MASKQAYIRYRVINQYLLDYGAATKAELIKACELALDIAPIGERTFEEDLSDMRHDTRLQFYAPIIYDHRLRKYRYEDEDYSIDNIPLNVEELGNLKFAASLLSQYDNISYLEQFQGTIQKIVTAVNFRRMQEEELEFNFIDFEKSPIIKGTEFLEKLVNHIKDREVIDVTYRAFTADEPSVHTLHPYLLKEYRNRWYLIAWNEEDEIFKIYGLERMEEIRQDFNKPFHEVEIDFENFFRHTIGITVPDQEPTDIVVAFSEHQSKYIVTQPVHPTQMLLDRVDDQKRNYFSFHLIPTFEFNAMILGWASEVEVISPDWYREGMKKKIEKLGKMYR